MISLLFKQRERIIIIYKIIFIFLSIIERMAILFISYFHFYWKLHESKCKFKDDRCSLCLQKSLDIQLYSNFRESARSNEVSEGTDIVLLKSNESPDIGDYTSCIGSAIDSQLRLNGEVQPLYRSRVSNR